MHGKLDSIMKKKARNQLNSVGSLKELPLREHQFYADEVKH